MSNLILKIANAFGSKTTNVFNVSSDKTTAEIFGMLSVLLKHQRKMYQEEIPESMYLDKSKMTVVKSVVHDVSQSINIFIYSWY